MGDTPRPPRRDIPQQMTDHPLRKIVRLNLPRESQLPQSRYEAPMPADHPFEQSGMGQMIQAPRLPVPLTGRVDERDSVRLARRQKPAFERRRQCFGVSRTNEPARDDRRPIRNACDRLVRREGWRDQRRGSRHRGNRITAHAHQPPLT